MSKPLEKITKQYPKRGPLTQFRFDKSISFHCFRCGQTKTAKLITIYNSDWKKRICNGCYGRLLSIYDIKAGQLEIDDKIEKLLEVLIKLVDENQIKEQLARIKLKSNKVNFLTSTTIKFFATSEYVAQNLTKETNLDWSPAIIGLCKAFELELIERFINPLKEFCKDLDFQDDDVKDKDFGKIASYCSGKTIKSPELGVVSHFLTTAINSKDRFSKSPFLNVGLKGFLNKLPNHNWIIDKDGLSDGIVKLTSNYRNKAAHTDELNENDYLECKNLVFGEKGIIWELIMSSERKNI